ncbi:MAG: HAD family phosphatase [Pyrinomonadaceae bacterium]
MIKAILMDFNGVIIDDESIQWEAYQEVFEAEGIELTEAEYFGALGMDDRTLVRATLEKAGKKADESKVDEIVAAKAVKWKAAVEKELPLFEGIDRFVKKMSREFALGIVSMAGRDSIEYVLEKSNLRKFFATIVSAEDVDKCKPDPACYRLGFNLLDAFRTANDHLPMTHGECLVIEDSPPGVIGARAADLPVLGVANTVSTDELRAAGAGATAKDLRDWMPESIRRVF